MSVSSKFKLSQAVADNGLRPGDGGAFEKRLPNFAQKPNKITNGEFTTVCPTIAKPMLAVVVLISSSICISSVLSSLMVLLQQFEYHICLCQCRQTVEYHFLKKQGQCE